MWNLSVTTLLLLSTGIVTSEAAVLPSQDQLFDTLHQALSAASKETGLRLKRSSSDEWDKELDLTAIGVLFRIKFNDVEKPEQGGKAHIKFPGSRFIRNAPFDDVDLQVDFDGSQLQEGLLHLKIGYKFIQKFKYKADLPRQGSISLIRSFESGEWRNKLVMKEGFDGKPLEHLLDLRFKSATKPNPPQGGNRLCDFMSSCDILEFSSIIDYKVGNYWDLKGKIQPGQKANLDLTVNGFVYSAMVELDLALKKLSLIATYESRSFFIDFELNPGEDLGVVVKGDLGAPLEAKLLMQQDLTLGQIKVSFDGQDLAFAQLKGEVDFMPHSFIPEKLNYVLKYKVGSEAGKAKIELGNSNPSTLQVTLVPTATSGKPIEHDFKLSVDQGFPWVDNSQSQFQWDINLDGKRVQKAQWFLVNNNTDYNLKIGAMLDQTQENPLFETWNSFYGTEITASKRTCQLFISKSSMDEILNNQIVQLRVNKVLFEDEFTVNGETKHHIKYDTRAPKTRYLLRYAPEDHPEAEWKYEGSREVGDRFFKLDHKITHGESVVQEGKISFESTSKLPEVAVVYLQELTTSPESPVYPLIQRIVGRHGTKIVQTGHLDLVLSLQNFKLASSLTVDEQKISGVLIDNYNTGLGKGSLKHIWSPDTFGTSHEVGVEWERQLPEAKPIDGQECERDVTLCDVLKSIIYYKRGEQQILSHTGVATWKTGRDGWGNKKLMIDTYESFEQTEDSPLYSWGPTLQGKYWRDGNRTLKLEAAGVFFPVERQIFREETYLDGELYRKLDINISTDSEKFDSVWSFTWEQPSSGKVFPSTRDLFNQDMVIFTVKDHPGMSREDLRSLSLISNLPNVQSLNVTYEEGYADPNGLVHDTLVKLIFNEEDLVTFETDHTDNSARLTVFPGGEDETMVCLAIPNVTYPAWPSSLRDGSAFPFPENPTERKLVFNMTRGQDRVDVVMSGIDNFIYGHSMFEPQSIGLDITGAVPSLGEFKICREATFQVFGETENISTYKMQWSGRDEFSEGDLAAFSPMDTMVVVDLKDKGDSTMESYLKSSSIQAYKSFGGKRWGFNLTKDNFRIITGISCKDPISC